MQRIARIALIVVVALMACAVAGCGETVKPEKATPEDKPKVAQPETFAVGDVVKAGKVQVTLHGTRAWKGDQFNKPKDGQVFLIAEATIENTSDKAYHASSLMQWHAVDNDGVKANISLVTGLKGSLDGEIGPGRKIRGEVAFDVAAGKKYEVVFEPEALGSGQVIWSIGEVK